MKKTRRIAAMIAALALATCSIAPIMMTASAATGNNTITINKGSNDELNHSAMAAYQIFTGTAGEEAGSLNVTGWGDGIKPAAFYDALKADKTVGEVFTALDLEDATTVASAVTIAEAIAMYGSDSTAAEAVARIAVKNITSTFSGTFDSKAMAITNVADGYYVVIDTEKATVADGDEGSYTLGMLKVSKGETVEVTTKVGLPTFNKQINDVNDSSTTLGEEEKYENHDGWSTDADYDMGDKVPFLLTATLPSNYDDYVTYKLVFHDDLQADVFTLNADSIKVYYGTDFDSAEEVPAGKFAIVTQASEGNSFEAVDGKTDGTEDFTVTITNVKDIANVTTSTKFFVAYDATLTTDANVGSAGNWNGGYLEYSNNPNWTGKGDNDEEEETDETPKKYVVAFTYKTDFTKVDSVTGDPLEGAKFSLYKLDRNSTSTDKCTASGYTDYVRVAEQVSSGEDGTFNFTGLDDGEYVLVEDEAPEGYEGNEVAPIPFKIIATHGDTTLVELNGVETTGEIKIDGFVELEDAEDGENVTVNKGEGSLAASIANSKETTLPSTGGMGTVLFYTVGGVLVAGAGVVLVTKKRLGKED